MGLLGVYAVSLALMVLARAIPSVFTVPVIVPSLSFVPGALVVIALTRGARTVSAEHVLYAFGSSLIVLMFVGAVVNIVLPFAGVARPLMPLPLGAGVTVAVVLLGVLAYFGNPSGSFTFTIPSLWRPTPLALLLLPLLSIIGVTLINETGVNLLLVAVLLTIGAAPIVILWRAEEKWYGLAIWMMALAILYHKSLWQYAGFGGRPHGIVAWEAGRWSPGVTSIEPYSSELLQNGVLFPLYARLTDLFILTQYEVVNPFFVAFIPLALYVIFRRYVDTRMAFLGATIFAFVHPFYLQYPTAGRAATPVIFLVLFGVSLSNDGLSPASRALLAVSFLAGVVVTHYGTSYYVAAAFCGALVLLYALKGFDFLTSRVRGAGAVADGGSSTVQRSIPVSRAKIFSISTVFFLISASLGWYLYTRQGWKFELLPRHVTENILTLIRGPTVGGRTAARVQETYSSISIQLSRDIYILLAGLIAIGLLVVYYRRMVTRETEFDDHYLTIASSLFGIFCTTLILSNWGGGRPMMISFSFASVFAVIGAFWLGNSLRPGLRKIRRHTPSKSMLTGVLPHRIPEDLSIGTTLFASFLLIFFLLNTGVAAATVFNEFAPSNVPGQANLADSQGPESQVTVHRGTDIVTHVWLVQHLVDGSAVWGDTFGARQFDWYRPDVAARTPVLGGGYTPATKPEVLDPTQQRAGNQPGYLIIMGHNLELSAVWPGKFREPVPLDQLGLERRNLIYDTGESHIYI